MKTSFAFPIALFVTTSVNTVAERNGQKVERRANDDWYGKTKKGTKTTKSKKDRKSEKGKKSKRKGSNQNLMAKIDPVDSTVPTVHGIVSFLYNSNDYDSALITIQATGLSESCSKCTVQFLDKMSCSDLIGDDENFWEAEDEAFYNTYGSVMTSSAFTIMDVASSADAIGGAVVLLGEDSKPQGCGILENKSSTVTLKAEMGSYPDWSGDLDVSGEVAVTYTDDGSFKFEYDLIGLETECFHCGIHIHAGVSCDTPEDVMGHGWNSGVVRDLWTTTGGAFYDTNDGTAKGYFSMYNGFGLGMNYHHAVVIHASDGVRIGCGVLM